MGASDLLVLEEHLSAEQLSRISITGAACLGLCREHGLKPPFVQVNDGIISMATIEKVLDAVKAETEGGLYAYDK